MRTVGLTGGIGSGKSSVAAMLAARGAVVVDADVLAREAVAQGTTGLAAIVARFGPGIVDGAGDLDRKQLGAIVFADPAARAELNAIVHPRVAQLAAERFAAAERSGARLCVYDVPLLYENGLDRQLPDVIVVSVSPSVQRARIAARDGFSPAEIEQRIAAQLPLADKVKRAQFVIDNDGDLAATQAQVERLVHKLVGDDS